MARPSCDPLHCEPSGSAVFSCVCGVGRGQHVQGSMERHRVGLSGELSFGVSTVYSKTIPFFFFLALNCGKVRDDLEEKQNKKG